MQTKWYPQSNVKDKSCLMGEEFTAIIMAAYSSHLSPKSLMLHREITTNQDDIQKALSQVISSGWGFLQFSASS